MDYNKRKKLLEMPSTARWRIVGWILLTTALMILILILTARSIFIRQVHVEANMAIIQEVQEFNAFAKEAVDPRTHRPFSSITGLMERYLERQTPDRGEAFIAITPTDVLVVDNAGNDAGERLAANRERLNALLDNPKNSGLERTPDGQLRWGKSVIEGQGQRGVLLVAQFVKNNIDAVHRNMLILFGVMLGGLLLTALIAWLVAGQILAPIKRFTRFSENIDAFNLDTRLPEDEGTEELSRLARSLNNMLDRLGNAHLEQKHILYAVLQQIQEHAHTLQYLERQYPADSSLPPLFKEMLENMQRLSRNLELLLESGNPDFLHYQKTKLDDMTYRLAKQLRDMYPAHKWEVAEVANIHVPMDPQRILLAMHHLAHNATEHDDSGEAIELGSSIRHLPDGNSMASFWIVNQGLPLSDETVAAVFEPAVHKHDPSNADAPRMGIGLAVVKALAHAHGGYAWVESGSERGTVFGIDIPLTRLSEAGKAENVQAKAIEAMQQEQ
ncbi:sensor histidine kinase [Neisseria dumasiana]|uniref:histidine kinase n=1 Tax=Neisseria dumasiana TaxID=1931275 RepID=A0A1X3DJ53_9NEIS|nr:HAMP domain-containing sensor histidine kinase [Neisseria dumasiana]OSI23193.1 hypothetical protein BV912_04505 [Neisseria dumasiana]